MVSNVWIGTAPNCIKDSKKKTATIVLLVVYIRNNNAFSYQFAWLTIPSSHQWMRLCFHPLGTTWILRLEKIITPLNSYFLAKLVEASLKVVSYLGGTGKWPDKNWLDQPNTEKLFGCLILNDHTRLVQPSVPVNALQLGLVDLASEVIVEELVEVLRARGAELELIA